ncbi:hypothetical protein B0T18DRAFT_428554 [Schizothecium vesticola]|uniref:Cyanovirin-N domain-containing protein n=1 Tax=Schizothecium vesticola TaxID=314040 RepID=A0AA40F3Y0_9PEZI|nr:hypothetical protein B0T18DRAFT_428554 [Schizothecium vesticola]
MKSLTFLATAMALLTPTLASPTPAAAVDTSPLLAARATVFQSLNCKRVKGHGDYGVIVNQGLTQLLFKSGKPSSAAGKTGAPKCNRVFCDVESNSGIFWCNSNTKALTLSGYGDIADGVMRIAMDQTCLANSLENVNNGQRLSGQVFYKEGYNVIVGSC